MESSGDRPQSLGPTARVGPRRHCVGIGVGLICLLALAPPASGKQTLSLPEVERRLVQGGYLETLAAAPWAVAQGQGIVPLLSRMLEKRHYYESLTGGATGAFPFNVLWALAHLPGEESLRTLKRYYAATHDATAALAIQGYNLRQARGSPHYGILLNGATLWAAPAHGQGLRQLKAGQAVQILQENLLQPQEEGPRGGPASYDRVRLLPGGPEGYVERAGDGFTPFI